MKKQPKRIGDILDNPDCPYLATNGNKCNRKFASEKCIYSKNFKKCSYYNEWLEERIIDCGACENEIELFEDEDGS